MIDGTYKQLNELMLFGPSQSMTGKKKLTNMLQRANQADLEELKKLIEGEKIKPIIDC